MKQSLFWNILKQGLGMFVLCSVVFFTSCTKDPIEPDPPVAVESPPGAFTLSAPAQGTELPTASVSFSWSISNNATSYQLVIKQGSTVVHNQTYSGISATVNLQLGQSYSWEVTASNNDGSRKSTSQIFSTMDEPVQSVVTTFQSAPYFEIVYDYPAQTIHPSEPINFGDEGLTFSVELYKQICLSCDRELVNIRTVSSLAELQMPMPVERYRNYYIVVTASKPAPGEAQVSYTQSIFIFKDNRYNGEP